MGLLGSQARGFNDTVREAALTTNEWGMGVQELAKLQSSYSEELGRTVMLGDAGLKSMSPENSKKFDELFGCCKSTNIE